MNEIISKYFFYYPATLLKGERIFKYLNNYREFQNSSRDTIEAYQLIHLKNLIKHAGKNSPYYKKVFNGANVNPEDITSLEQIKRLPVLTKELLITHRLDIETVSNNPFITKKTTGGSTGQAVTLLKNPDALARERAATARSYEWAGVEIGDSQARFWGIPLHQNIRFKSKVVDFIANRRRYSAFAVDPAMLQIYFEDIVKFKPKYLYGYASSIRDFALFLNDIEQRLPASVKAIITTSEVLTKEMREDIESSLHVRVYNEYGCGEVGSIAHECEAGSLHVMEDNLFVEIDASGSDDAAGEIIVTDLFNYATPLIRYRIGDYASIKKGKCACGRTLISFDNVHGRAYDCIISPDGKIFHPELIMYIFEDVKDKFGGIKQFQVIQKQSDQLLIRLVLSQAFTNEIKDLITNQILEKLHYSMKLTYEFVDQINREPSGKIRLVKSDLQTS